jgi:hypothetical protein
MSAPDQTLLLPATAGMEAWRTGKSAQAQPTDATKVKQPQWIGVPMRSIVSLPMRFSGMSAERQREAASLELEGIGLSNLSTTDVQIQTRDAGLRDQRAWTAVLAGQVPSAEEVGIDSAFAPTVSFKKLRPSQAALWTEQERLIVAIPDEHGQPLHAQALTARDADEDAAAELRCILAAMDLAGLEPIVHQVAAQHPANQPPPLGLQAFAQALDLPVEPELLSTPHAPAERWDWTPGVVVQQRDDRRQRQNMMLMAAGSVLVILAMLATFGARLWSRDRSISSESARIAALQPQLDTIRTAQSEWGHLDRAVNPQRYAVEIFAAIAEKLPAEGIRMTNFQIQDGGAVTIDAEASNQALAGQFREDLNSLKCFEGMTKQIPPFGVDGSGRATFHADIFLPTEEGAPAQ